jgi:hypothetical protein
MNTNRKIYWGLAGVITLLLLVWYFTRSNPDETVLLEAPVKQGLFVISVTTTGELEAKSSEKIYGPSSSGLREARIWELKIDDIIPDGSIVDSGDYVANLDRTELTNKLKDKEIEIEQFQNNFTKTQLDTTMELRSARNDLVNLKYAMEEAQIAVDQSIYEPPASQRQVQIELDKSKRSYDQADRNYSLRTDKAVANMSEVSTALKKKQGEYQKLMDLISEFTVKAPKAGMVIYQRDWEGKKRGIGSTVSAWENVVATLPNLREMITKTYVNEIDISKVKVGQKVNIGIDAFPDKKFTGQVLEVANIGEQIRNSNAKVFEVKIAVNEYDSIVRPAMTTKNTIITDEIDSVLFIPLEAMFNNDSIQYVIVGKTKKQVITGKSNENEIVVLAGLTVGENVLLSTPSDADDYDYEMLSEEIIQAAKERKDTLEKEEVKPRPEFKEGQMPGNGGFKQRPGGNGSRQNRPSKR